MLRRATNNLSPSALVVMRGLVNKLTKESGHEACRQALLNSVETVEDMDTAWTDQVNELRAKIEELESKKYHHFFFTCPEPGTQISEGVMEFSNCVLNRDFGHFLKGYTVPQIVTDDNKGTILFCHGKNTVMFKVELILQE